MKFGSLLALVLAASLGGCVSVDARGGLDWYPASDHPDGHDPFSSLRVFPLPAPPASAQMVIPDTYLVSPPTHGQKTSLDMVADRITFALDDAGYSDHVYLPVDGGFALLTRVEKINADGTSVPSPKRFGIPSADQPDDWTFSFSGYLAKLLTADVGYYRVIVFVVTQRQITQTATPVGPKEFSQWFMAGTDSLPPSYGAREYDTVAGYHCTALIYEFQKSAAVPAPHFVLTSAVAAVDHLKGAGVWDALSRGNH